MRKLTYGNAGLVIGNQIGILTVIERYNVQSEIISIDKANEIEATWKGIQSFDPVSEFMRMIGGIK